MFLALSKILDLVVAPVTWVLACILLAMVYHRRRGLSVFFSALAFVLLLAFSSAPVTEWLTRAAERRAVSTFKPEVTYDAAIVLGGMTSGSAFEASGEVDFTEAASRITTALELWREGRVKAIVLSGGDTWPDPGIPPEADRLKAKLVAWGVPEQAIVAEDRSRNTRENALESARVVTQHGFRSLLLVTSAVHMPRALGCFHAVGLLPDALPVDHRADGQAEGLGPRAGELSKATDILRELTGRVVYLIMGYTR